MGHVNRGQTSRFNGPEQQPVDLNSYSISRYYTRFKQTPLHQIIFEQKVYAEDQQQGRQC